MDEHRVGLKPVLRRVWTKKGIRPIAPVWQRFQARYLSAFVEPQTGQSHWFRHPKVNVPTLGDILASFARTIDVGQHHRAILVLDGAGWHTSDKLVVPDGLHLVFLPSYSPELAPAERLWQLSDEPLVNHCPRDIEEVEALLDSRCADLTRRTREIRDRCWFEWWPSVSSGTFQ